MWIDHIFYLTIWDFDGDELCSVVVLTKRASNTAFVFSRTT